MGGRWEGDRREIGGRWEGDGREVPTSLLLYIPHISPHLEVGVQLGQVAAPRYWLPGASLQKTTCHSGIFDLFRSGTRDAWMGGALLRQPHPEQLIEVLLPSGNTYLLNRARGNWRRRGIGREPRAPQPS